MRGMSLTRCVVVALFAGALACARNQETGTAAVQDSAAMKDTTGQAQNPPGYRGIETDTNMVPRAQQEPVDTFLQQQGVNPRADTSGYHGAERDTTGQHRDTTGVQRWDTTTVNRDTTGVPSDSSAMPRDTMPRDTTTGR